MYSEYICNPGLNIFRKNIFQQGAARIAEEEKRVRESNGEECDMTLKNNIEGIIIKWAYQTDEVTSKRKINLLL